MNRLVIPILLFLLSCKESEISTEARTYVHDSSLDALSLKKIVIQIDSVLNDTNLSKIDSELIFLAQMDSLVKIEFKRKDTIEYYLKPYYQVFTNSLSYQLSSKNLFTITSHDDRVLRKYVPKDSIVYQFKITSEASPYFALTVINPITSKQSDKIVNYMDFIFGYMTYETDSALSSIYLDQNNVILELSYQEDIPIDKNGAKYFKHTANLISDSVFNGWQTEVRLLDGSRNIIKSFHNVDTTYVFSD